MRFRHLKHIVVGVIFTGVALGLLLILTGILFILGCLIVLGFTVAMWAPVLLAFVRVVIPEWWRDRFGPPK